MIRPALLRGLRSFFGKQVKEMDIEGLVRVARAFIETEEPSIGELRKFLQEREPTFNKEATAYAVRPRRSGLVLPSPPILPSLFRRYLSAFGPASVMDFQTWSGMTGLKSQLGPTLAELRLYHSEDGKALYDLPGLSIIAAETEAPIRFLPEYDNILIAHRDRSRILPAEHRGKVFRYAGRRVTGAILIDGFVGGRWAWYKTRKYQGVVFSWRIYKEQPKERAEEIEAEGRRLSRFIKERGR